MLPDKDYIILYRTLIEKKFMLGSGDGKLKQRELEYLGNLIEEKSKIRLSISTLKRLWRNDPQQLPHPSTLDALASILDFNDWQEFKKQHVANVVSKKEKVSLVRSGRKVKTVPIAISMGVIVLVSGFFLLQGFNRKDKKSISVTKEVVFTADKTVTAGVPNTVMFNYDLSGVHADSFFIQQSWNPRDRVQIDPAKNYYSAIYYTPGFHFARIMANDSILKFRSVHIKTDGWMPIVKYDIRDHQYMYPDETALVEMGVMKTTGDLLRKAGVDVSKDFFLRYYNIRDFDGVDAGNFSLQTKMKCDKLDTERSGRVPCPSMEVMIITEQNIFFVPLSIKGCVSELDLALGEIYKRGRDNDLSAFGTDVYEWQQLEIMVENKKASVVLNGRVVHELSFKNEFGKIKGLLYTFTNGGSIDFVRMKDVKGNVVYGDEFDEIEKKGEM